MAKRTRIPLLGKDDNERLWWTVYREQIGWMMDDHTGYTRYMGKNWLECVERLRSLAENHGCTITVS